MINKTIAQRYQLQELIGQGGMADVYLAYDPILHRTVAIKIMRSSLTGDTVYVNRFNREATAAAALNHKNIVSIYDVGEDDENYYIVMEYVPGHTLKELIKKRGALHYVEAIDIMKQVLSAVATAHAMGIVHRDLKPQNIMVTDSGIVKIGDFGIASIQSLSQVTQTDTIMGSLHYLAPEVARGERASQSSDIYALGIMLYELLRGEVPFNGESAVNIALKHMRDEIPSIHEYNPSIPQSLENIIIKATVKNTAQRYQSADEMLQDLVDCLNHPDEEKVVFDYKDEDGSTTKIASEKDFFTSDKPIEKLVDEPKVDDKKKNKTKIAIISIVSAIVVILAVLGIMLALNNGTKQVPDVKGMTQEEAIQLLESEGFKINGNVTFELDDNYDEGVVISTNPAALTPVKKKSEIGLTVSSGKYIIVNDFKGYNYDNAKETLEEQGFKVLKEEESSTEPEGTVLAQSINAGDKITPSSARARTIKLTVAAKAAVPSVIGKNINEAQAILEKLGMTVVKQDLYTDDPVESNDGITTNIVRSQSIDPDTEITAQNNVITLEYYSKIPNVAQPVVEAVQ